MEYWVALVFRHTTHENYYISSSRKNSSLMLSLGAIYFEDVWKKLIKAWFPGLILWNTFVELTSIKKYTDTMLEDTIHSSEQLLIVSFFLSFFSFSVYCFMQSCNHACMHEQFMVVQSAWTPFADHFFSFFCNVLEHDFMFSGFSSRLVKCL